MVRKKENRAAKRLADGHSEYGIGGHAQDQSRRSLEICRYMHYCHSLRLTSKPEYEGGTTPCYYG